MGQKRSDPSPSDNTPAATEGEKPTNKREAVERALAAGVEMPKDISEYVKKHFNLEVTPAYVSTIKGNLKKEEQPQSAATTTPSSQPGLTPQDLAALADIAQRVGGIQQLQEFLTALQRIR